MDLDLDYTTVGSAFQPFSRILEKLLIHSVPAQRDQITKREQACGDKKDRSKPDPVNDGSGKDGEKADDAQYCVCQTDVAGALFVGSDVQQQGHHPNWSNVYNRVEIHLNTHDAGNIVTDKDHQLARAIDKVYQKFKK